MTTITAISMTSVPRDGLTNAEFATAFGHALAVLPIGKRFTAKQICDLICPDYANQKCVAYLRKAHYFGIVKREEAPAGVWVDANGVTHQRMQALYYRV